MLHLSTIDSATLELLKKLQALPALVETRLVGGTALALQIGHRKSIDLDLFGRVEATSQQLVDQLKEIGKLTVLKDSPHIHIYLLDGVKVDIVDYSYPWIDKILIRQGVRMGSSKDIAAMKTTAIIGRGTKKDFIDFAFLLKQYSLNEILDFYSLKYPEGSRFMAMKSLAYFEDAEEDMMPYMLTDMTWEEVKQQIELTVSLL